MNVISIQRHKGNSNIYKNKIKLIFIYKNLTNPKKQQKYRKK